MYHASTAVIGLAFIRLCDTLVRTATGGSDRSL